MAVPTELDVLCDFLEHFEREKLKAETGISNLKAKIQGLMRDQGLQSTTTKAGRKLTIVEPVKTTWNENVLKDILGPLWPEVVVVKESLDPAKLEVVVDRERIPPKDLEEAVVEHEVRAYLKITKPKGLL